MRISDDVKLDFKDVLIQPKRSSSISRSEINLHRTFKRPDGSTFSVVPIIAANMDHTGTFEMALALAKYDCMTALHKHYPVEEYIKFWNKERKSKAEILKMTQMDVSILASIVDSEALNDSEMPKIAGLYMNRLIKGMRLEADPTVIYAANDFTIRRVLNKHLRINSPYNTYLNKGLPPGPITMPSINAIDAVLNYEKHD